MSASATLERPDLHSGTAVPEPPPAQQKKRASGDSSRLPFLDWTRGLAAVIMLQGHVFHSFARPDLRGHGAWVLSQFVGGLPPAIFLFLTGVTLAFGIDNRERKGAAPGTRTKTALRRALYLAGLAFAFRFQLWLFGFPHSPVTDMLKVDILNCMAVAIAALAGLAMLPARGRIHGGIAAGLAIACASPLVAMAGPAMPKLAQMYFAPSADFFAFFPWASFVAFGLAGGTVLRQISDEHLHRAMQWCAILGFGTIFTAQYFSNLPYGIYPTVDFWLNSPGLIFIKTGVILVLLSLAFLWTRHGGGAKNSWVRLLGTTSLLVYWVHIELVYGRWFGIWKEKLGILECAVGSVILIALMVGLAWLRKNWNWPILPFGSVYPVPRARRVPGS